jgi:hypothetical protein
MPEPRGRKKRPRDRRDRRRDRTGTPEAPASPPPQAATARRIIRQAEPGLPSPTARATGFLIAIVTGFVAAVMLFNALSDASGGEAVARVIGGALLILLAAAVAVACLWPAAVRDYFAQRRERRNAGRR